VLITITLEGGVHTTLFSGTFSASLYFHVVQYEKMPFLRGEALLAKIYQKAKKTGKIQKNFMYLF